MKTSAIRQAFLDFFQSKGHAVLPSSSLIPGNDPTLLFTNAGMVQFKDVFLGRDQRPYTRAVTSQRCVRAGGKHNDLENVGYTARHHTFFEMLGNFSFGDYFKRDAIHFAWEFLTSEQWLNLPKEKLWVTVYASDDEAFDIWTKEVGVPAERVIRIGDNKGAAYASDNFWQMGDTGPCGPCTEIFYDHGPDIWGGPPGSPEEDGDRYIEIWNNVFMQFDRQPDGTLEPLPKPSVDTGMGLERISAVMQHVHSNYEIDLFANLLKAVAQVTQAQDLEDKSLRVVADHIRSCAFLIVDGVVPSNEGRGYVLRRILRRAIRHGNKLGAKGPFFHQLVAPLVREMGEAYPELAKAQSGVEKILLQEEEQFARTLEQGLGVLNFALEKLQLQMSAGQTEERAKLGSRAFTKLNLTDAQIKQAQELSQIPGKVVFLLKDTYGFPEDLTADIARERGLSIDWSGFEVALKEQQETSKDPDRFRGNYHDGLDVQTQSQFSGYEHVSAQGRVTEIFVDGQPVQSIEAGQPAQIVLDNTPFYAESGGQVGDVGTLETADSRFDVTDTTKQKGAHMHGGVLETGTLKVGDTVNAVVNNDLRQAIRLNHSATHLMHAALRQVLGTHVQQKGSMVTASRLRFDFSHSEAVKPQQLREIEKLVNDQIRLNTPVQTELMAIDDAKAKGAMALFGEKYDDNVRVLTMGSDNFSIELCGGTHASRTGDIGLFRIVSEGGVAAGVRRIEAVTGAGALEWIDESEANLAQIAGLLKGSRDTAVEKVQQILDRIKGLEKELEKHKAKLASSAGDDLLNQAKTVAGVKLLNASVEGVDGKALREMVDKLKDKLGSGVILLGVINGGKVDLVAGVTKDLTGKLKAGDLVKHAAEVVGGKGGGRPDLAMAGGPDVASLPSAIAAAESWLAQQMG